jgi:predicted histone-like DNA-binding protein
MKKTDTLNYGVYKSAIKGKDGEALYHVRSRILQETVDFEDFCDDIEKNNGATKSDVKGVMEAVVSESARLLSSNHRVHLQGLGYFTLKISLRNKKFVRDPKDIRSDDVYVSGVDFLPEKGFVEKCVRDGQQFQQIARDFNPAPDESTLRKKLYEYFSENAFITVKLFADLFGISSKRAGTMLTDMSTGDNARLQVKTFGRLKHFYPFGKSL